MLPEVASAARLAWSDLTSPTWNGISAIAQGVAAVGAITALLVLLVQLKATQGQLRATQDQLHLDREQAEAARRRARPRLEVRMQSPQISGTEVRILYASGSEPAYIVQAWASVATVSERGPFQQGNRLLHAMTEQNSGELLALNFLTPDQQKEGPFDEVKSRITLSKNEWWAAVTWQAADGTQGRWGYFHRDDAAGSEDLIWDE